jgi:hypothetical protein
VLRLVQIGGFSVKRVFLLLAILVMLVGCSTERHSVSADIIKTFESNSNENDSYNISISDITDFKWDKLVVFGVGSSNDEVSRALGIEYKDSTDLMEGLVFKFRDGIVYKEELPYNPEHASKIQFHFEEGTCITVTPDSSTFICVREKIDDKYYYMLYQQKKAN